MRYLVMKHQWALYFLLVVISSTIKPSITNFYNVGEGGPMVTHTADCSDCDFRLAKGI